MADPPGAGAAAPLDPGGAPLPRLNIGSGRDRRAGEVNLDLVPLAGVDVVADLECPLPFADGTFGRIVARHVIGHVENYFGMMQELHRITAPGGRLEIVVPHFSFPGAYADPTHRRFFGFFSFDYFASGPYNFYTTTRFRILERRLVFYWIKNERHQVRSSVLTWLVNLWPALWERFFCWILPVHELQVTLEPEPIKRPRNAPQPEREHPCESPR
jgi:SAM-dependent methyltransferase